MREIRTSGSEGGASQTNGTSLPLFVGCPWRDKILQTFFPELTELTHPRPNTAGESLNSIARPSVLSSVCEYPKPFLAKGLQMRQAVYHV